MNNFYDNSSLAAAYKREQFLQEAQDYNLRRELLASQKAEKKNRTARKATPLIYLANLREAISPKNI